MSRGADFEAALRSPDWFHNERDGGVMLLKVSSSVTESTIGARALAMAASNVRFSSGSTEEGRVAVVRPRAGVVVARPRLLGACMRFLPSLDGASDDDRIYPAAPSKTGDYRVPDWQSKEIEFPAASYLNH